MGGGFCGGSDGGFMVGFLLWLWYWFWFSVGRGSWVTNLGFMCVMGFGCYNGGAVTCHGGAVTCGGGGYGELWLLQPMAELGFQFRRGKI